MTSDAPDTCPQDRLEALHVESYGWALTCCRGDRDLAEETLQHSYLKVLEHRVQWARRSSFKTWLFGVVRLTSFEVRRRRAWSRLLPFDQAPALVDPRPNGETDVLEAEEITALREALASLSEKQHQVLHLVFYQDLTVEDAAQVLGMRLGTARTHYQRGKARLRLLLSESSP